MKTNHFLFILAGTALMVACGKKPETGSLETKKLRLDSLKTAMATTAELIKTLETEISQLDTAARKEEKVKIVSTSKVETGTFLHYVDVSGSIEAEDNIKVSVKMPGLLTSVRVKEGQRVTKGQLLATQDADVINKSIDEIKNGLELAKTLYDKQKSLWEQKIGSEIQYLQAKNQKENLEKRLKTTEAQLAQASVYAPVSGVVEMVYMKEGELASPGVPLFQIVNLNNLKVTTNVPDAYLSTIKEGDAVVVELPDLKQTIKGTISRTGKIVDPATRTIKVEVRLANTEGQLRPNMLAIVKINDRTITNTIVLEENLVQQSEIGQIVFVAGEKEGRKAAKMKKVETGLAYGGKVQVLKGLEPGEQLITTGYQDLVDGQLISN